MQYGEYMAQQDRLEAEHDARENEIEKLVQQRREAIAEIEAAGPIDALRFAIVDRAGDDPDRIAAYLPANYSSVSIGDGKVLIAGRDKMGWTMDDYVLPRLASGLVWGREISIQEAAMAITKAAVNEMAQGRSDDAL